MPNPKGAGLCPCIRTVPRRCHLLDILISGGLVVDGTGNPGFYGAVGVEGDKVHIFRGDLSSVETSRTINAAGKVIAPGFIDVHAHSGLVMLTEPRHEPKV